MKKQKKQIIVGLLFSIIIIGIMSPLISNVRAKSYARGYVKDDGTRAGIASVYVTVYGRYEDSYGRLKSFSRSGYTNSNGYYSITLPSTTVYTNGLRAIKTGYVTYDGSVVNPVYLSAKSISLRFTGKVLEDQVIDNIKVVNAEQVSLDIASGVSGYSNILTDKVIYVRIYDKCNNLLRTVSCNQVEGHYDTGSFGAPAGNIKFEITSLPSDIRKYKTLIHTEEILSSTTASRNFYLQRDLGEVWVNGHTNGPGAFDEINDHKVNIEDTEGYAFIEGLDFSVDAECPPTIVYNPWGSFETYTFLRTSFDITGATFGAAKCLTPGARVSLYARNQWSDNVDILDLTDIHYDSSSQYSSAKLDWTVQASLGYSGLTSALGGQIQLSSTYTPPQGVSIDYDTTKSQDGDWTRLGYIDVDYTDDKENLQKKMDLKWEIQIDNGENYGELFSLYECGSNIQFKVVHEFNLQCVSLGCWATFYGKIKFEQILGDNTVSGITTTLLPEWGSYLLVETFGNYDATDYTINLLRGESAILYI